MVMTYKRDVSSRKQCRLPVSMWCYRLRHWHSSPLFVLISFVLAAGLVVQLKTLYDNHQRYLRVMDYQRGVDELAETVEHVDKVMGRISVMRKKVETYVDARRRKNDTTVS